MRTLARSLPWLLVAACTATEMPSTSATIDEAGGMVALGDADLVVTIPPSAVALPTTIGLALVPAAQVAPLPHTDAAYSRRYELTPHGMTFAVPVEIAIRFSGDPETARVLRLDDRTDPEWEVVEGATFADGVARFATDRFSVIIIGGPLAFDCGLPGERCCEPGGPVDDRNLNGCDDGEGGGMDVCDEDICSNSCRPVLSETPPNQCATSRLRTEEVSRECGGSRVVCQEGGTDAMNPFPNGTLWYCCD